MTQRPRRYVSRSTIGVLLPLMQLDYRRDAYVLRGVGDRVGPVLRPERRRRALTFAGPERRATEAAASDRVGLGIVGNVAVAALAALALGVAFIVGGHGTHAVRGARASSTHPPVAVARPGVTTPVLTAATRHPASHPVDHPRATVRHRRPLVTHRRTVHHAVAHHRRRVVVTAAPATPAVTSTTQAAPTATATTPAATPTPPPATTPAAPVQTTAAATHPAAPASGSSGSATTSGGGSGNGSGSGTVSGGSSGGGSGSGSGSGSGTVSGGG